MAAFDYVEIQALAKELIEEFGRPVSFVKLQRGVANPRLTPAATVLATAAFVDPVSATELGLSFENYEEGRRFDEVCVVAYTSLGQSIEDFDELWDGAATLAIEYISKLQPGPLPILYGIAVKR